MLYFEIGGMILIIVYQSYLMKQLQSSPRIAEIQSRLAKYTYLSRNNLPGYPDGIIFETLKKCQKYPDRAKYPHFYHWYILLRQFAAPTIAKWIADRLYYDSNDALIYNFIKQQTSFVARTSLGTHSNCNTQEQGGNDETSLKKRINVEVQYEIDILLKVYTKQTIYDLLDALKHYQLDIAVLQDTKQVKIKCGKESSKRQQIANIISKTIEYSKLQVKRNKKDKTKLQTTIL